MDEIEGRIVGQGFWTNVDPEAHPEFTATYEKHAKEVFERRHGVAATETEWRKEEAHSEEIDGEIHEFPTVWIYLLEAPAPQEEA